MYNISDIIYNCDFISNYKSTDISLIILLIDNILIILNIII